MERTQCDNLTLNEMNFSDSTFKGKYSCIYVHGTRHQSRERLTLTRPGSFDEFLKQMREWTMTLKIKNIKYTDQLTVHMLLKNILHTVFIQLNTRFTSNV